LPAPRKSAANSLPFEIAGVEAESVTRCLLEVRGGREGAEDHLLELVYKQLRKMAGIRMAKERKDHTLQATALANEVALKLIRCAREVEWEDSAHFYKTCSLMMRNILVDHARRKVQGLKVEDLLPGVAITKQISDEVLALDQSLKRLEQFDPRGAKVVELTQILGLRQEEVAIHLNYSLRTVKRDLRACLNWLRADMNGFALPGARAEAAK